MNKDRPHVTRDDFLEWKDHPVTQAYFDGINFKIKVLQEQSTSGELLNYDNPAGTGMKAAYLSGWVAGLADQMEIIDEVIIGEDE